MTAEGAPIRPASTGRRVGWPAIAAALVLLLLYAFWGQGARGLWKPDEGRYTCVALNMLESGDWLVPRLNHENPHFTKPPLTYWAVAASLGLWGHNEWAARFPSALAFTCTVLLVLAMGRQLAPRRPWLPALIYASSPLVYSAANLVTTDTLLTLWETLAMFGFLQWFVRGGQPRAGRWLLLMWLAFGLAFLTKGPPGLLPLLPILALTAWRRGGRSILRLLHPGGLALFALVGFSWYAVVIHARPDLLGYFLHDEVYGRIVSGQHHRNAQWYGALVVYIPTLLLGGLPWSFGLILKRRGPTARGLRELNPFARDLPAETQLLLLWFLLPLAVLFLARSRLPLYLLPLFVPFSLLIARRLEEGPLSMPRWRPLIVGWMVLLMGIRFASGSIDSEKNTQAFAEAIRRQVPMTPKEIVFVDDAPDFGLRFYLGSAVEAVNFKPDRGEETIDEEMTFDEFGRLFIIRRRDEDDLLRITPGKNRIWSRIGDQGKYVLYAPTAAPVS